MSKIFFGIFLVASMQLACKQTSTETVEEPDYEQQLSEHILMSTLWFQRSAEARALYYQCFTMARIALSQNLAVANDSLPFAVVFDIDETVLDNSPFEVERIQTGTLYDQDNWEEWTRKSQAKALPGALEFVKFADSIGVNVFYISNRKEKDLQVTIENLKTYGFVNADTSHVLLQTSVSDKTPRREKVLKDYNILLYLGDNLTDYSENYADRGSDMGFGLVDENSQLFGTQFIILPNPMYGEWEKAAYNNDYSLSAKEKDSLRRAALIGYDEL